MAIELQTCPYCGKPRRTNINDYPPVMNEAEAAEFLGISVKTVSDYTRSGKIPHIKLGRRVLIGRDVLLKWFEEDQAKLRYFPYGGKIDDRLIKAK